MFVLLLIVLVAILLVYVLLRTETTIEQEGLAAREVDELSDIVEYLESEKMRMKVQEKDRKVFLSTLVDVDASELSKYTGCRQRLVVPQQGNGYEFLHVSDTEDLSRPGVYGIYCGSTLLYVGKATGSIRTRFRDHAKSAKYITQGGAQQAFLYAAMRQYPHLIDGRVLYLSRTDDSKEIAQKEMELIDELHPVCNIVGVKK